MSYVALVLKRKMKLNELGGWKSKEEFLAVGEAYTAIV